MKVRIALLPLMMLSTAFAKADSVVVFNEIHYHPDTAEATREYIELHNQMAVDVDMSGWRISGGVDYTFPPHTILLGRGHLVVALDPAGVATAYGATGAFGPWSGRLSNSGENLKLRDNNNRIMDELDYGTNGKWPLGADGAGPSLSKIQPNGASDDPTNWTTSLQQGGTPGEQNFATPGAPFIPPSGLVSWWRMDEASGATTADAVGGNTATLGSGPTRVAGLTGAGALNFNNTSADWINAGTGANFSVTGGLTIEAVIKSTWNGTGTDVLFSRNNTNIPASLAGYYPFNEAASGTTAAIDGAGIANGVLTGSATRVAGRNGSVGAVRFNNAASDGVNIGAGAVFTTGITISAWIKPGWSGAVGDYDEIFRKNDGGLILLGFQNDSNNPGATPPVAAGPVLSFGLSTSGYKELDMPLDGASGRPTLAQLKDGNWHHIAATYDSATGLKAIYVDGTVRFSTTLSGAIVSGGAAAGIIGNQTSNGEPFTGDIDDFALFKVGLTSAQVATLANNSTTPLTVLGEIIPAKMLLALQNDGNNAAANPPVPAGPVLSFGLNAGNLYSELDMPLDGTAGRPTVANLTDGQEHHVAATYDAATGLKSIFVDGTLRYSTTLSGILATAGAAPVTLGNIAPGGSEAWTGAMDEVAFWSRALTTNEISRHWAKTQGGLDYFAPSFVYTPPPSVRVNEIGAGGSFFIELQNTGSAAVDLTGFVITATGATGGNYVIPAQSLAPGSLLTFTAAQLGFNPAAGSKLFFLTPASAQHVDSVAIGTSGQGRTTNGVWAATSAATQSAANAFAFNEDVVISEIMFHPRPFPGSPAVVQNSTLAAFTDTWRYLDIGTDPGASWKQPAFSDVAWSTGPGMFGSVSATGAYAAEVAADAPLAWWRMDDATTSIADATGNGHIGTASAGITLNNAPLVNDSATSKSILISGANRVTVPGFEKIGAAGYSVEYWVKVVTPPTGFLNVVGDGESGGDFFLMNYLSPGMVIRPHYGTGNTPVSLDAASSLGTAQTYHIVTTWDAVNPASNGVIYINGVPDMTGTISRNLPAVGTTGNNTVFIGYDNREPGSGSFYIDEVAMYNRPLSAARVAAHYASGSMPSPRQTTLATGPVTHYFRKNFSFSGNPTATELHLNVASDDGMIVYLNGTEVHRSNMPVGSVSVATSALNDRAPSLSGSFRIPAYSLAAGSNLLAVEVHQSPGGNNDVFMGLELTARETTTAAVAEVEDNNTWLELYNRGAATVNLAGWKLDAGVDFTFAPGTTISPGARLIVADDLALFAAAHPGITAVGPLGGSLSKSGERILLRDAAGNIADNVTYGDDGRWPSEPDGGGSSLELRDARGDNDVPENWAASNERNRASWQTITYRAIAGPDGGPTNFNEFVLGLLDAGEVLIDDIHVISEPGTGNAAELVTGGNFESGAGGWRLRGTHETSAVVAEPGNAGNHVLRVKAVGGTDVLHNCIETTLAGNVATVPGREYEISLRAKWQAGANLLNTRLYWNQCAQVTRLNVPSNGGTPGAANSAAIANSGPTFTSLNHTPAVPAASQACTVSINAADPDNVASVQLFYAVDGGAWLSVPMTNVDSTWSAAIPGQAASALVQLYLQATDGLGATSNFPAKGADSRALIPWNDGLANLPLAHNFRLLMTAADRTAMLENINLLNDSPRGATVIYDEAEVFYDVGARLKGSEHGRSDVGRQSYNVSFSSDHKFRGVHDSVLLDRSGGWRFGSVFGQDEILVKHIISQAGGVASLHDDIVRLIAPHAPHTGPAMLQMARYGNDYLDSMYENGGDGNIYKMEIAYHTTGTDDGLPTGNKQAQEGSISNIDLGDRGADKEAYRWFFGKENNEENDDFTAEMNVIRAFSKSGEAFDAEIDPLIDNDEWMRCLALETLCGISDIFSRDNGHNINFYQRPKDGKVLALPWDWDFAFIQPTNAPLWGGRQAGKLIQRPGNLRRFYSHLQDLINGPFNVGYMSRWVDHYDNFAPGQDFSSITPWIAARAAFVQSQIPASAVWSVTTAPANEVLISNGVATFAGTAPLSHETITFEITGANPFKATFTSVSNWSANVPILLGRNVIALRVYDSNGVLIPAASQNFIVIGTNANLAEDTDFDGLPDAWEKLTGLDLVPGANALTDSDRDGQTDIQEYLAGTNPLDGNSFPFLLPPTAEPNGHRFFLPVQAGRKYYLEASPTLGAGSWNAIHTVLPTTTDGVVEFLDAGSGLPREFYRLRVE